MAKRHHVDWNVVGRSYNARVGETGDVYHRTYLDPVVLRLLGPMKGSSILDLGCGQGRLSRLLARRGARVTGVDVSEKLLRIATRKEEREPLGITYHLCTAAVLSDTPSSSIDAVLVNMVLHSVDDIEGVMRECARVTKKAGRLVFSVPSPTTRAGERIRDPKGDYLIALRRWRTPAEVPHSMYGHYGYLEWYRPMALYFHLLFENGFVVTDFEEIYVRHSDGKRILNRKKLAFKQEFPSFAVVGCQRRR